ncbi:unnamed protein product [Schistosoma haematobium]|nr:unnamed protein product [Schistosoma haematobium]
MFFICRDIVHAFSILTFTCASDPACSSMMFPIYVNDSTSSIVSPSNVIVLIFSVLYLKILVFPFLILRFTDSEAAAILVAFIYICSCVCDRRARSSAKSKSFN